MRIRGTRSGAPLPSAKKSYLVAEECRTDYHCSMLRSGVSRILSITLLFAAGSIEPAWELGHAVIHLETAHADHDVLDHTPAPVETAALSVLAANHDLEHEHPVFQRAAKPGLDLIVPVVTVPADAAGLTFGPLTIRFAVRSGVSARASPTQEYTSQPRAPPLV